MYHTWLERGQNYLFDWVKLKLKYFEKKLLPLIQDKETCKQPGKHIYVN